MIPAPEPGRSAKEILRRRARALAAEPPRGESGAGTLAVLEFGLADERYALELGYVRGAHPLDHLTPVPCTPEFVAGILNVRGRIVAVIDLKRFFDLPARGIGNQHRVVVVHHQDVELGILADFIAGTREIPAGSLAPALPTLTGIQAEYVKGITGERLVVLDAARILGDPKLIVDETPNG
jgi:purine-binding chemotaxis protein CheW